MISTEPWSTATPNTWPLFNACLRGMESQWTRPPITKASTAHRTRRSAKSFCPTCHRNVGGRLLDEKEAAYRADLDDVEPIAGAIALLDFADRRGLKCALVTNAPRANAEAVLAALGLEARLSIVVVGSELARSKPDPLPYLAALERTRALASGSVAFEDSPTGVRAAAAAGLAVVGVTTSA